MDVRTDDIERSVADIARRAREIHLEIINRPRCGCDLCGLKYKIHWRYFERQWTAYKVWKWARERGYDRTYQALFLHLKRHGVEQWAWEKAAFGVVEDAD